LQASKIIFIMAKESDIQATGIIHCTKNEINEKDVTMNLKLPLVWKMHNYY
jgi:hypothetical protein